MDEDDMIAECCDDICEDRPIPWLKVILLMMLFSA